MNDRTDAVSAIGSLRDNEFAAAYSAVMADAREAGLDGFSGSCWAAAAAINRVVFGGRGELVVAVNDALADGAGRAVGHAAVLFRGAFWDADGRPKDFDEIESWGMLDPADSDYRLIAEAAGITWTEDSASQASVRRCDSESEFLAFVRRGGDRDDPGVPAGDDTIAAIEDVLRTALTTWWLGFRGEPYCL